MEQAAIFKGTYSDMRPVRSRKVVQIVVEIPIEQGAAFVAAFGMPNPGAEHWVAVAKLDPKAITIPEEKAEARRWDQLPPAQQAGIRCAEPAFQKFINEEKRFGCISEAAAAAFVREWCGVKSRADIAADKGAAEAWALLDGEYLDWRYAS